MKKTILIFCLIVTSFNLFSKSIFDKINSPIPKETLISDFNKIVKEIETHPGLFENQSKDEWQKLKNQQFNNINDSCSTIDFYRITLKLVAKIGCAHTWLINNKFDFFDNKQMYLPYEMVIIKKKLFITKNLSKNYNIPIGSEVTHINDTPISELLTILKEHIPSDAYNTHFQEKMLESSFPYFYHSLINFKDLNSIKYIHDSININKQIQLTNLIPKEEENENGTPLKFKIDKTSKSAMLSISTFAFYEKIEYFNKYIDSCFIEYHKNNLEHLIIDLRGNQGGTPECSSHLLRYFYTKPFIYYINDHGFYPHLRKSILPYRDRLIEKPIILIDGNGVSTTGHFCAMLKAQDLAIFVGEETGGTYYCYSNVRSTRFKDSKFSLQIAQQKFEVDASELSSKKGISPNFEVSPSIEELIKEIDPALLKALELIK